MQYVCGVPGAIVISTPVISASTNSNSAFPNKQVPDGGTLNLDSGAVNKDNIFKILLTSAHRYCQKCYLIITLNTTIIYPI